VRGKQISRENVSSSERERGREGEKKKDEQTDSRLDRYQVMNGLKVREREREGERRERESKIIGEEITWVKAMSPESSDHWKLILELERERSMQDMPGLSAETIKDKPLLLVVDMGLSPLTGRFKKWGSRVQRETTS